MYDKEELDDLIDEWHKGDDPRRLHEFLGWTWEEYAHWVETCEQPPDRVDLSGDE